MGISHGYNRSLAITISSLIQSFANQQLSANNAILYTAYHFSSVWTIVRLKYNPEQINTKERNQNASHIHAATYICTQAKSIFKF